MGFIMSGKSQKFTRGEVGTVHQNSGEKHPVKLQNMNAPGLMRCFNMIYLMAGPLRLSLKCIADICATQIEALCLKLLIFFSLLV